MKLILSQDIPEIGRKKGETAVLISNVKLSYLVRFEDGKKEWLMGHAFDIEDLTNVEKSETIEE
jgi:hypothetical protein